MSKKKVIGIFLIVFSYIMLLIAEDKLRAVSGVVTFNIIGLFLIFKNQEKKKRRETSLMAKHQVGLPLAEGVDCKIEFGDSQFIFQGGGNNFNLTFDKITDICVKSEEEIQRQFVSSAGGAVAGGMIFGPLGALIGGRIKEKKTTKLTFYLIFTYKDESNIHYICFDVSKVYFKSLKWERIFRKNFLIHNQQSVNL